MHEKLSTAFVKAAAAAGLHASQQLAHCLNALALSFEFGEFSLRHLQPTLGWRGARAKAEE